jgi:SM-20-related protein
VSAEQDPLPTSETRGIPAKIARDLEQIGWSVTDDFLSPLLVAQLAREMRDQRQANDFRHAGIGRGGSFQVNPEIRTDQVRWLDPANCTGAQSLYLNSLELLRLSLNQQLFLGLFEFEGHLAIYPPGSFYRKHLDQFKGVEQRVVTAILYLNEDWRKEDGGQLRIYTEPQAPEYYEEILPIGGRLVTFLSARYLHEVMPAQRDRLSLTGWFKVRG